jgi:hypothetical protein
MTYFLKYIFVYFSLLAVGAGTVIAQPLTPKEDSRRGDTTLVPLYFRLGQHRVDSQYMNNREAIARIDSIVNGLSSGSGLDSVSIVATASSEGMEAFNATLAQRRAQAVYKYLIEQYPTIQAPIVISGVYVKNWADIREAVEADTRIPAREALLRIINAPEMSNAQKEQQIRALAGGSAFSYLLKHILPYWREGSVVFRFKPAPAVEEPIIMSVEETVVEEEIVEVTIPEVEIIEAEVTVPEVVTKRPESWRYPVALRTNLLLDLIGGPNIGVEVPLGHHFSVAADFAYAHTMINNRYAFETLHGNLEGRYWWRSDNDRPLTGWNVGIYGTYGGRYDIQWQNGVQGDRFWSAGVFGGYSLPIGRALNLDFSLGAGYLYSPQARFYERPQDGHLIWKETRYNTGRFTLTRVRVGLVWLIGTTK